MQNSNRRSNDFQKKRRLSSVCAIPVDIISVQSAGSARKSISSERRSAGIARFPGGGTNIHQKNLFFYLTYNFYMILIEYIEINLTG